MLIGGDKESLVEIMTIRPRVHLEQPGFVHFITSMAV